VACTLVLDALMSGVELDSKVAVTGDMNASGKVRPVGGIAAKIRGAKKRSCNLVGIPVQNKNLVNDVFISDGMLAVSSMQVFTLTTFEDALAVARTDRSADHTKAIETFATVQKVLARKGGERYLKNAKVQSRLAEVLNLAPNHLTARILLDHGKGRGDRKLSLPGSLQSIDRTVAKLLTALDQDPETITGVTEDELSSVISNLRSIRTNLDSRTTAYADSLEDYASLLRHVREKKITGRADATVDKLIDQIVKSAKIVDRTRNKLLGKKEVMEELLAH
jgi:predicted S18 family serine protease